MFLLGVLACLDGYMNIALEQTEEYVGGQLKNKYGDAFIRGNNGNISCIVSEFFSYNYIQAIMLLDKYFRVTLYSGQL